MNALVTIGNEALTPAVFSETGGIDAMLEKIKTEVRAVATDISTPAGRKAVASLAHKVARSKTAFDGLGKELAAEWKVKAKAIDVERARVWDELEALQAEVRKPLDDYEAAEAKRIADHQGAIQTIIDLAFFAGDMPPSSEVISALTDFEALPNRDWQEFKQKAATARSETFAKLHALKGAALAREEEAAELERLRTAEADRLRRERENEIANAAAAAATKLAEDRAAQEAQRIADETAARERKAEQDKADALALADKIKRTAEEAAVKAERDRIAAEAQAEADRVAAIVAERQRVADIEAAEAAETERREADKAHRKQINSEALKALVAAGLSNAEGIKAITAIVRGKVPNVSIRY